jgi:DMSO/TMAO reductase YedYZ molybdopterin-dependent catalytic subunit
MGMRKLSRRVFLLVLLSGCAPFLPATSPSPNDSLPTFFPMATLMDTPTPLPTPSPAPPSATQEPTPVPINQVVTDTDTSCLAAMVAPTEPAVVPSEGGLDKISNRHVMGTVTLLDAQSYRLVVKGLVDHPLSLSYDDLRCLPKMTETVTTTCYNFQDTATWSGVLLSEVLKKAGLQPGAKKISQSGADGAVRSVDLEMAMDGHNFLAYQMGNKPLPIFFGFPVRSIFIDVAGQFSVKWLTTLEVI